MKNNELESKRPTFFLMGMTIALSVTLMAFEWRVEKKIYADPVVAWEDIWFEPATPEVRIKVEPQPKSPAAAAPTRTKSYLLKIVPDNTMMVMKQPGPTLLKLQKAVDPAPRRIVSEPKSNELGARTMRGLEPHELPYMRLCGSIKDDIERFQCTQLELKKHVMANFRMPSSDEIKDLPSRVSVTFTIDSYGQIVDVTPDQVYPKALDMELERVVKTLPEMVPAVVNGDRISVRFDLPIQLERH